MKSFFIQCVVFAVISGIFEKVMCDDSESKSYVVNIAEEKEDDIKSYRTSPFNLNKGRSNSYQLIKTGIKEEEHFVGYVYYNNDSYTDIITYKNNSGILKFQVHLYDFKEGIFNSTKDLFTLEKKALKVKNLFPTYLFYNDSLSFILTVEEEDGTNTYVFSKTSNSDPATYEKKDSFKTGNIVIADIDGDRRIEIIYNEEENGVKNVRKYDDNYKPRIDELSKYLLYKDVSQEANNKALKYKIYASAFIDVDADCKNDLIIQSVNTEDNNKMFLEVYRGRNDTVDDVNVSKYVLDEDSLIEIESDSDAFTLGDFDDDGLVDIAIPKKNSHKITILYNMIDLKYDWTEDFCKEHTIAKKSPKVYSLSNQTSTIEYDLINSTTYPEYASAVFHNPITNMAIRSADFKSFALPGFVASFKVNDSYVVILFKNSEEERTKSRNGFTIEKAFELTVEPNYAAFFDIDEDGNIDLLIDTKEKNQGRDSTVLGLLNTYIEDAYFVKAQTLLKVDSKKALEIGTGYRFIATSNNGERRMDYAWQLSQVSDLALNMPYALAGIGRSNNYIENFRVISSTYDKGKNSKNSDQQNYTPIIPKTQLLITKTLVSPKDTKVQWNVDLIVSPTESLIILVIVVVVVLLIILIVIIILHCKEVNEDKVQEGEKMTSWFD